MSQVLSVRVSDELARWADEYAAQRGVSRTVLLENAIRYFKEDCDRGMPELREQRARLGRPASGECCCPVIEDPRGGAPKRGFRQRCPVHGFGSASADERREAFNVAGAARSALFRTLKQPDTPSKKSGGA